MMTMPSALAVLRSASDSLQLAAAALAVSVLLFGFVAVAVKGRQAIEAGIRAIAEVRMNLAFYFFDALFVAPGLTILIAALTLAISGTLFRAEHSSGPGLGARPHSLQSYSSATSCRTGGIGLNTRPGSGRLT